MDSAALDPRLRSPHDSSSISVSVAPAASSSSSSPSPSPSVSTLTSASIPAPNPNPNPNPALAATATASGPGSGSGHRGYTNGSVPGAASSAFARTPSSVPSPELQRLSQGVHFPTAYSQAPANAPAPAHPFPASHATSAFPDDHPGDHDNSGADPKKARACEACRGLKVRCEPVAEDPDGACKRCAKAGRNCIITQPTRKRQKKTDNRVAELEKKIDALTATLSATKAGQAGTALAAHPEAATGYYGAPGNAPPTSWNAVDGTSIYGTNAVRSHGPSPSPVGAAGPSAPPGALAGQKRKYTGPAENGGDIPASLRSHGYPDLVDRGIITIITAAQLLHRYNYQMAPHLPGVVFPPGLTAGELRKTKPVLFLAVMAAASSDTPEIQRVAVTELMQTFADRIIIVGEKSLELVQALTVAVMWYRPPEHVEDLNFYQFVHMAMTMALDLGLGKGRPRGSKPTLWGAQPSRRHPQQDPTTIEARRTWLLCYYMTVNTAMGLHRPFLLRWTSFMAECMDILESSPEAAPTDKYFCHLVWTHRLVEEIGFQFCMDDPSVSVNLSDHMTQHRIKSFERELDNHKTLVPVELMQRTCHRLPPSAVGFANHCPASLKLSFHTLSLYMHELALQTDPADAFKEPFPSEGAVGNAALTPAYTSALAACLTAIDGIIDTFLGMDPDSIRCLPVFNLVRVSYATVILIKIYSAASNPSSDLGKVIDKDSLKVEQHLSNLVEKFRVISADHRHHPASNFLIVAVMVRSWFLKFSQGQVKRDEARTDTATTNAMAPGQSASLAQASNNPLQLLSEAATNNQAAASNPQAQGAAGEGPQSGKGNTDSTTAVARSSSNEADPNQNTDGGRRSDMPPPPNPQAQAHPHQHGFIGGTPAPWLKFGSDLDPGNLVDGFTEAWDLTMEGLGDGQNSLQYFHNFALGIPGPLLGPTGPQMPGSDAYQP